MAALAKRQNSVITEGGTVYSVVYVTAEPTFTGVIGGYTTITDGDAAAATTNSFPGALTQEAPETSTAPTETVVGVETSSSQSTRPTQTLTNPTTISNENASSSSAVAGANSTSGASSSSSNSSDGLSVGAKAGIAVGVIAVVGLIGILLLFCLGRKKKQRQAEAAKENEKATYGSGAAAGTPPTEMVDRSPTSAQAPRLSLRPVSRMLPEFMGSGSKTRLSGGNLLTTIGESGSDRGPAQQQRGPSPIQNQPQENPFADPQNPFADPEKPALVPAPLSVGSAPHNAPQTSTTAVTAAGAIASAAAAGAVAPRATPDHSASNSMSNPAALPRRTSQPSTPVTPAPVVATGPGAEQPQGNVYRVMMDFKPSMEDELELVSGSLVRMLHEYDDGWALCIRLDRSQQGVVPRTCLAAKPSKPKPAHLNQYANSPQAMRPAPGGGSRPMSPAGNYGPPRAGPPRPMSPAGRPGSRPMSPAGRPGSRPMSPAGRSMSPGPFNQAPRPLSPGPRPQQRSMSPGPYGGRGGPAPMGGNQSRRRSNSASAMSVRDRRNSPPGPSNLRQGSTAQGPGIAL
ncbi:hypothetical protein B0A52_09346 [Exophiala mesophila]|uniref:SH3 domain-containing protein n=1 Tax=Exophiala mesophila TaxID=212818 RepID=A0A438MU90_EXOME|nr:hypothetical protein B0A52_09346 [Exophiala mesophila]